MKFTIDLPDEKGNVISIESLKDGLNRHVRHFQKKCFHESISIDITLEKIMCKSCGEYINPVVWIAMMAKNWERIRMLAQDYEDKKRNFEEFKSFMECMVEGKYCRKTSENRYILTAKGKGIKQMS